MSEGAEMRVNPQNYWSEVWHRDCPDRSPCRHLDEYMTIEDGSKLRAFECIACETRVFAGLDADRFVVHRPYEDNADD